MKRIRKEYLVFLGLIILVLLIFGFSNYKSNKPKYDKSKIHVTFNEEQASGVVESTEFSSQVVTEAETSKASQITEPATEVTSFTDTFVVNQSNIYDVINNVLSVSPNLEYCTQDFKYDDNIKTELELTRVTELENHFEDGYVLGYIETSTGRLTYRFDFTLSENKLASLTFSKQ